MGVAPPSWRLQCRLEAGVTAKIRRLPEVTPPGDFYGDFYCTGDPGLISYTYSGRLLFAKSDKRFNGVGEVYYPVLPRKARSHV